ncbi:SDR family oxidoreductase [Curtobacterium sp. B18]|uniref:SDR family oxidoreductase n=1 Tax=Curtobacterium sp. B18 TaxID=95614 RepID=UPI0003B3AD19|nr:aldehyde reductase [Curtobacterium sp. B18]
MTIHPDATVLVTGANGYLGAHITAALLDQGYRVRATVRSQARGAALRKDLDRAGVLSADRLDLAYADLSSDNGWTDAMSGARYVMHVASPFPGHTPQHEDDVIVPARDGALRVLAAARDASVERVVMTSSFAAVGYSHKAVPSFTESDWTNPEDDLQPYIKSKVVAERAAWDFVAQQGEGLEFSAVNPVGIFGPTLSTKLSTSVAFIKAMLDGLMENLPAQSFGVVDVRDAAALHLAAMTHSEAAGERFLAVADGPSVSFRDVAVLLHDELGSLASHVPLTESAASSDGSDSSVAPVISNAKAKNLLGWEPRPVRETLLDTAKSLMKLGLVGKDEPSRR